MGNPIKISAIETTVRIEENLEELSETFSIDEPLSCQFRYALGLCLIVTSQVTGISHGFSIAQNPSAILGLYRTLISNGRYAASTEQQRRDLTDLLIQIEPATEVGDAICIWRALRDRALVRKHLARLTY